jgi:hypothetical protein
MISIEFEQLTLIFTLEMLFSFFLFWGWLFPQRMCPSC